MSENNANIDLTNLNIGLSDTAFLGIDIGTETCKAVLLKVAIVKEDYTYEVISATSRPTDGATDRSSITNIDTIIKILLDMIKEIMEDKAVIAATYIREIYTVFGIHDKSIRSEIKRVSNLFSKHDRVITHEDMKTVLKNANNSHIDSDREHLHIIPRAFYVNEVFVEDETAIGKTGSSIDVEILLISILKERVKQIELCAQHIEYPSNYLCATGLAVGESVLTEFERKDGTIVIDFGAGITSAAIFENSKSSCMIQIPLGGIDITRDLANVLQLPMHIAEFLKCSYGVMDEEYFMTNPSNIRIQDNQNIIEVNLREVYNIVVARTLEILTHVKQNLLGNQAQSTVQGVERRVYPVVVTGGTGRLLGLMQLVEHVFNSNARIAQPWNWGGPHTKYQDPTFSAVIGIAISGHQRLFSISETSSIEYALQAKKHKDSSFENVKRILHTISEKFRNLLSLGDIE